MDFDEYQQLTKNTAIYPGAGERSPNAINYCILGLIGEAGELANVWKKSIRDQNGAIAKETLRYELGDVLWYVARLADELNMKLEAVGESNIEKLRDRQRRNVIRGSGDNR